MDTELLSRQLRAAAGDVRPRRSFADEVISGGRRRVRRRWTVTAVVSVLVVGLFGGALAVDRWLADEPDAETAAWLGQPTGGDLAGSRSFLDEAVAAWRAALPTSPNADRIAGRLRGEPHVYWAGNTPSGPVAVVTQRSGDTVAIGLYGSDASGDTAAIKSTRSDPSGDRRILTDVPPLEGVAGVAFLFGPDDRTMLAMDPGRPILASARAETGVDGRVERTWQQLTVTGGVALMQWPPGTDVSAVRVALATKSGGPDRDATLLTLPASRHGDGFDRQSKYRAEHRLSWQPTQVIFLHGATTARPVVTVTGIEPYLESAGMLDPFMRMGTPGHWHVAAALPDGRTAWVTEYQQDSAPSRVYAVIGDGWRVVDGGPIDPDSPLPVQLRLPHLLGWVVAAYGSTLRYRTADGPWVDAGSDAALLPDDAAAVEVTTPGRATAVVVLQR